MRGNVPIVTGATGQIGLALCRELERSGQAVRAVVLPRDPNAARLRDSGVDVVPGDVRDADSLTRAFEGCDTVYHLAAVVSTSDRDDGRVWQVNVGGARHAAAAARRAGVRRFVYFSSIVVFDPDPVHEPLDERRRRLVPTATRSPYVRSKLLGEAAVRAEVERGLDAVIVHPTVVLGPNETHHAGIVQNLIFDYFRGKLPAIFRGGFNLVGVTDLVAGAMAAAARGRTGESYILGGRWYRMDELLLAAKALCGVAVPRVAIPLWAARAGLPLVGAAARLTGTPPLYNREELNQLSGNRHISSQKARRELGYAPVGIDPSLRMIYEEWVQNERSRVRA